MIQRFFTSTVVVSILLASTSSCQPSGEEQTSKEPSETPNVGAPASGAQPAALVSKDAETRSPSGASAGSSTAGKVSRAASQPGTETAKTRLPSGLEYTVLKEGSGPSPKHGAVVKLHCTGWTAEGTTQEPFVNTRPGGTPKEYVLSTHPQDREVSGLQQREPLIEGMVEALLTMKPGEARKLFVPSELAYGSRGYPRLVPPNADLILEVELVGIVTDGS